MGGTGIVIDIGTIRLSIDHISLRSQRIKNRLCDIPCTSVGTVQTNPHSLKGIYSQGDQISYVYCPWDVINHVDCLRGNPDAEPLSYWINTSGNELVRRFIDRADKTTRDEIERLIAGESIEKTVRMELTYDEIDNSLDNLWSVLFTTGYLTQAGKTERGVYRLTIPNREMVKLILLPLIHCRRSGS